jgi:N-methylhydantoinase A
MTDVRLAADIGGTFTDIALAAGSTLYTAKILTTPREPAAAVLEGTAKVLADAGVGAADVDVFIHGTTLATNALIERRGAPTALLTTEGLRDAVEMAHENRFEQYDLAMRRPDPLVPRNLRIGIPERLAADGTVLLPLDEDAVRQAAVELRSGGVESLAIGFVHSYRFDQHERRARELVHEVWPDVPVTLSSEVCPEIREYERFSTACANAYVRPLMQRYLLDLEARRRALGMACPMYLMQSGGGLGTLDEALVHPVRLIESGPAGGALLAAEIARELDVRVALSFDMGGTTAKLCIIENGEPHTSREFEVGREYRFLAGSGLPLRLPVIDMVEIGAGGSSIARRDELGRIQVGPRSAGSEPGPAAYGRGGADPTVTDADIVLGRILPGRFAGGEMTLDTDASAEALRTGVAEPAGLTLEVAALGVSEVVDENMANAGRVHAIEQGCDVTGGTLIAFGGAAPLHAARVATKLGVDQIVVPAGAGVGSAIGFLRAPAAHEAVRTWHRRIGDLRVDELAELLGSMLEEATEVVNGAAPGVATTATARAFMRYRGQGHEITVSLPLEDLTASADSRPGDHVVQRTLESRFVESYRELYTRDIPGLEVEALTWLLTVRTVLPDLEWAQPPSLATDSDGTFVEVVDPATGRSTPHLVFDRGAIGEVPVAGPALVTEDQTTTVVPDGFGVRRGPGGHLLVARMPIDPEEIR